MTEDDLLVEILRIHVRNVRAFYRLDRLGVTLNGTIQEGLVPELGDVILDFLGMPKTDARFGGLPRGALFSRSRWTDAIRELKPKDEVLRTFLHRTRAEIEALRQYEPGWFEPEGPVNTNRPSSDADS